MRHTLAFLVLTACVQPYPPQPNPPPTPAATGGSTSTGGSPGVAGATPGVSLEGQACLNMMFLGCPEGQTTDCEAVMQLRCSHPKVTCATRCLIDAKTRTEAQTKNTPICLTWGKRQAMTWRFVDKYCTEAYAIISADYLNGGKTLAGLDIEKLKADLVSVQA